MNSTSWRRWFTDDPLDQEPMIADPEEATSEMLADGSAFMRERTLWMEKQQERAERDPKRHLDLSDLPKHDDGWKRSLPQSLAQMTPGLAVLLLTFGACVAVTIRRFLRYRIT